MYPEYAEVNGKRYKINTDFRVAIKCDEIARDNSIGDLERALAIVYTLFGVEAIKDIENIEKLLKIAVKYLRCGAEVDDKEIKNERKEKRDIDFIQDQNYIASSFKYDYGYNPYDKDYLHWYEFYNDLNNLSYSEFGSCCILSRIRAIRNTDVSKIKDADERKRMIEAQKQVAIKKDKKVLNDKQKQSATNFYKELFKE